jgi:predicted metal-dependent HD superfamily phosphohydrolase
MSKAKRYWLALMEELCLPKSTWLPYWDELEKLYRQDHRAYHRLKHIGQFLDWLYAHTPGRCTPSVAQRLAALFHDAVYDPARSDNEYQSWLLAKAFISSAIPDEVLTASLLLQVEAFILATASHINRTAAITAVTEAELDLFLDCDLLILASRPRAYDTYCRQIRFEYRNYGEADYRKGRQAFLSKLLVTPILFRTAKIRVYADSRARVNLRRELDRLG